MGDALARAGVRRMCAPNVLEVSLVLSRRKPGNRSVQDVLTDCRIRIVPFEERLLSLAIDADRWCGRNPHPAALNFGDCMAYALAKSTGEPLLFKGNDFAQTDILSALA